uniref:Putative secreted protein n=1 Tax=Amblyomma cajennense TaxID=34607 RepID=A0A023FBB0_AMBCJ
MQNRYGFNVIAGSLLLLFASAQALAILQTRGYPTYHFACLLEPLSQNAPHPDDAKIMSGIRLLQCYICTHTTSQNKE